MLLVLFAWRRSERHLRGELQAGREPRAPVGPLESLGTTLRALMARHRKRTELLHAGLTRFRQATESLPDAVLLLDRESVIKWSNRGAHALLGIHRRDRGRYLQHLLRQPELTVALQECARGIGQELRLSGTDAPLELRLLPLDPNSMLLLARDVSATERLEQTRRDFIANLSHELRTPLTVLSGFLEELSPETSSGELVQVLPALRREVRHMHALTEQLLQLSRLESADAPPEDEVVRMAELLQEATASLRGGSHYRGQHIQIEARSDLNLRGTRSELFSAASNLIMNALQYTSADGKIQVQWAPNAMQPNGALLEIRDQGSGIASEHLPLLTQRFYRVDRGRSSEHGNLGLGLAIVKHVLLRHNATLHIESRLGEGSSFKCSFPSERVLDAAPASWTPPSRELVNQHQQVDDANQEQQACPLPPSQVEITADIPIRTEPGDDEDGPNRP